MTVVLDTEEILLKCLKYSYIVFIIIAIKVFTFGDAFLYVKYGDICESIVFVNIILFYN